MLSINSARVSFNSRSWNSSAGSGWAIFEQNAEKTKTPRKRFKCWMLIYRWCTTPMLSRNESIKAPQTIKYSDKLYPALHPQARQESINKKSATSSPIVLPLCLWWDQMQISNPVWIAAPKRRCHGWHWDMLEWWWLCPGYDLIDREKALGVTAVEGGVHVIWVAPGDPIDYWNT